ncbi:MAG: hypothetical protein M4579_001827 [Chaenotheca gracillima]|nr:MAG: hypothetical protein M4579_001827 [Chaenotheca gracillima]
MASSGQAMEKRSADTALMPPPPAPKRTKRPPTVLDEDAYTDALSSIIARDFFPGLLESHAQQDYLNALDSQDNDWIAQASRKLTEVMTPVPGRRGRRGVSSVSATPRSRLGTPADETPRGSYYGGDTPMSVASDISTSTSATQRTEKGPKADTNLSLDAFLAKYTSEDNASFSTLLEHQNRKRAEKYAWARNGDNKIPAARQLLHRAREQKLIESSRPARNAIEPADSRPAVSSKPVSNNPSNTLMFPPDTDFTPEPSADPDSRAPPKAISYNNTRLTNPSSEDKGPSEPPTPSLSAIDAAIAGHPRRSSTSSSLTSVPATPRVNGYSFVDDSPSPPSSPPLQPSKHPHLPAADSTPNPFKLQSQPAREKLHHSMVDRTSRNNRASSSSRAGSATPRMTPYQRHSLLGGKTPIGTPARMANDGTPIPRFGFGGQTPGTVNGTDAGAGSTTGAGVGGLTPAAQRLWNRVGATPRDRRSGADKRGFGDVGNESSSVRSRSKSKGMAAGLKS